MPKLIVAHRGAPKLAHENTLEAFQKAIDLGADLIELDVRKTKDGVLAVFHDDNIDDRKISEITFVQLNQQSSAQGFAVPSLEQALKLIAGKARVQIEIKEQGYEQEIVQMAIKILTIDNFWIISFNFASLLAIGQKYPGIKLALIIGTRDGRIFQIVKFLINRKKILNNVDGFSLHWRLWAFGLLNFIPAKYQVTIWTADEPELIKKLLLDERVTNIASNFPDLALKLSYQNEP